MVGGGCNSFRRGPSGCVVRTSMVVCSDDDVRGDTVGISPPCASREEDRYVVLGADALPPEATVRQHDKGEVWMTPSVKIDDPYGWMRLRENASACERTRVMDHIESENNYTQSFFADDPARRKLQLDLLHEYTELFDSPDDSSNSTLQIYQVYRREGYYYYTKRCTGRPYPIHCRLPVDSSVPESLNYSLFEAALTDEKEQVILDENLLAKSLEADAYFAVHSVVPIRSSGGPEEGVVFSVDRRGDEMYTIYLLEKMEGTEFVKIAENTSGTIVAYEKIHADSAGKMEISIHSVALESRAQRPYQWREWHRASDGNTSTCVLYTEPDEGLWGDLQHTSDFKYVVWTSESSSKIGSALAKKVDDYTSSLVTLKISFQAFSLDHSGNYWWILNKTLVEKNSARCQLFVSTKRDGSSASAVEWPTAFGDDESNIYIDNMKFLGAGILLAQLRVGCLQKVWLLTISHENGTSIESTLELPSSNGAPDDKNAPGYFSMAAEQEYGSQNCIFSFESMVTPPQIMEYNFEAHNVKVLHGQCISGICQGNYISRRLNVPSRDGKVDIPVSVVYHKDTPFPAPMHLLGYGAYGHSLEPSFSKVRLPLLSRGVVCAIAHVRGGGELGHDWYLSGKGKSKMNSVHDFCDVASWLLDKGWTESRMLAAEGRSAGGLLVASAMNECPSLFKAAVLGVPFLDILCTMADSSLPLTTMEYEEWGNPHTEEGYKAIRSYSPIHNIYKAGDKDGYPSCFLIGGFQDQRVPYWEPLKFAAVLRHATSSSSYATRSRPILVKMDLDAGHSFGGHQENYLREISSLYAFVLDQIIQVPIDI